MTNYTKIITLSSLILPLTILASDTNNKDTILARTKKKHGTPSELSQANILPSMPPVQQTDHNAEQQQQQQQPIQPIEQKISETPQETSVLGAPYQVTTVPKQDKPYIPSGLTSCYDDKGAFEQSEDYVKRSIQNGAFHDAVLKKHGYRLPHAIKVMLATFQCILTAQISENKKTLESNRKNFEEALNAASLLISFSETCPGHLNEISQKEIDDSLATLKKSIETQENTITQELLEQRKAIHALREKIHAQDTTGCLPGLRPVTEFKRH